MGFTAIGYSVSHAPGAVYTALTPIPDQHARVEGNSFVVPDKYSKLFAAFACMGTVPGQCRIVAPSLRNIGVEYITPVIAGLLSPGNYVYSMSLNRYIDLQPGEQVGVEENSDPLAAEQHAAILLLADTEITPIKGLIRSLGFTVNSALVVDTWVNNPIVFDENIPTGTYKIVGIRLEVATGIAARIVVPGMANRPGFPTSSDVEQNDINAFRYGALGEIAQFNQNTGFSLDLLGSAGAAAADYRGVVDVIKM